MNSSNKRHPLRLLQEVHNAIRRGSDYSQVVQIITDTAVTFVGDPITHAILFEPDPRHQYLNITAMTGFDMDLHDSLRHLPLTDWPSKQPAYITQADADTRLRRLQESVPDIQLYAAVDIPLRDDDGLVAILTMYSSRPTPFTEATSQNSQIFSQEAVLAMQTARLFHHAQKQTAQANILNQIARAVNANLDLQTVLNITAREVKRLVNYKRASASLLTPHDPTRLRILPLTGLLAREPAAGYETEIDNGGIGYAIQHGRAYIAEDLAADQAFPMDAELYQSGIQSYICLPLIQSSRVIGTLNLGSAEPNTFGQHNLALLTQIGDQIAIAIQNARLYELSQRRILELDMLNDIGRDLSSTLDVDSLTGIIHGHVKRVMKTDNFYMALLDAEQAELEFLLFIENGQSRPPFRVRADGTLTQYIVQTGKPLFLCGDLAVQVNRLGLKPGGHQPKVWMGVPMIHNGQAIGALAVQDYDNPEAFDPSQTPLLQAVANQAAAALQNARLYTQQSQHAQQEAARRAVLAAANNASELPHILDAILTQILEISKTDAGWVFLCLNEAKSPELSAAQGLSPAFVQAESTAVHDCDLCHKVITHQEGGLISPMSHCAYIPVQTLQAEGLHAHISTPITHQNKVIGILNLATDQPDRDLKVLMPLLTTIGREIGAVITHAHLYQLVRQERQKLQAILDDTTDLVLVLDTNGRILLLNAAAEKFLRTTNASVQGTLLENLELAELTNAFTQAQHQQQAITCEIPLSQECTFNASISPVHEVGWALVLHDITYLKELDKLRTEWVASVSHDLKNPITLVEISTDLLERVAPMTERQQEIVKRIRFGVSRLRALVMDVLDLARLEAAITYRLEPVDMLPIIQNAVSVVELVAQKKQQTLELSLPKADLPAIMGDENMLMRVLVNLLNNAIKYTPENGRISLTLSHAPDHLQITIQDTGPGIPADALPHIFDRFYRVPNSNLNQEGVGIGLSVVKGIVEKHHGRITVESTPGSGSTFTITLPIPSP